MEGAKNQIAAFFNITSANVEVSFKWQDSLWQCESCHNYGKIH